MTNKNKEQLKAEIYAVLWDNAGKCLDNDAERTELVEQLTSAVMRWSSNALEPKGPTF